MSTLFILQFKAGQVHPRCPISNFPNFLEWLSFNSTHLSCDIILEPQP